MPLCQQHHSLGSADRVLRIPAAGVGFLTKAGLPDAAGAIALLSDVSLLITLLAKLA